MRPVYSGDHELLQRGDVQGSDPGDSSGLCGRSEPYHCVREEMIDPTQLTRCIIRPVLKDIGYWSINAEKLVLGTCCQESDCGKYLEQLNGGPAKGIYQSERPAMADNVDYIRRHDDLAAAVVENWMVSVYWDVDRIMEEIVWNHALATVMCRVHYLRFPEPIPDSLIGQAQMWKVCYNTEAGAGTVEEYIASWRGFVPSDSVWV